jgi:Ca-activated chloride channel family protein
MNLKALKPQALQLLILIFMLTASGYAKTIKGIVYSKTDQLPIPGVLIKVLNTNISTNTDFDGKFSVEINDKTAILQFSFLGYKSQQITVSDKKKIKVYLEENTSTLNEIVVLGNGSIRPSQIISNRGLSHIYDMPPINSNTESYATIEENGFKSVTLNPLSTFSVDVDGASYSNIRRYINGGALPPIDAIRVEEMINYFDYNYKSPKKKPFSINTELSYAPWNENHLLLHVGLKGKTIDMKDVPHSNIVFLLDVSGSMNNPNKLPLVKSSLKLLLEKLRPEDRVAIVVYAGNSGLVLPSTSCYEKEEILTALDNLRAGGSTAGGAGLKLAYKVAEENFITNGNNRIVLATDGDFNVGQSSNGDMLRLIENHRDKGIGISVLGFGMGNYKDDKMEIIANKGNGNYAYIDNLLEAKKVLVNEFGGTFFTIAQDVKFQLEFNPAEVEKYRLIGYENRLLNEEDFEDDTKDAGEIGAGHTVTALYEIIPKAPKKELDQNLKYQDVKLNEYAKKSKDLVTLKLRYKQPGTSKSKLLEQEVKARPLDINSTSNNFRFSAAVAGFGMLLRDSKYKENITWDKITLLAKRARGEDELGYRGEFIRLVNSAKLLDQSRLQKD